jgi:hypothetical protein
MQPTNSAMKLCDYGMYLLLLLLLLPSAPESLTQARGPKRGQPGPYSVPVAWGTGSGRYWQYDM